jgi:hypothetical protein
VTTIYLKKNSNGLSLADEEAEDLISKIAFGSVLKCNISIPRNYEFHKKYFALLDVAFDAWEPGEQTYKDQIVQKNKERFRKDIQILAGYGYPIININGDVRFESKSISFGSMEQPEFEKLYSAVINVILAKVLTNYTRKDLDEVVKKVLNFD